MINYVKSENYRLLRKKGLYITSIVSLLLITAAAFVLHFLGENEINFPYATSTFFYSNVIAGSLLIIIVAFVFNQSLTGKDISVIKQSVSFGVSRNTIFWAKLLLPLCYFLFLCVIGLLLMIVLGENLLFSEGNSIGNFLLASLNMLPLILGAYFIIHILKMLKVGDLYTLILLLIVFMFSGDLLRLLFRPVSGLQEVYKYAPSSLLNENLMDFMDHGAALDYRYWVVGMLISVASLSLGARRFAKQNID
ncbi:ABC transporter permease [Virgibacillus halodenitrificans]|uniref:ABC transporter permease n=1 Tax=Virgibacillus halodenitrificans TaxID=1482 RepID=A0AAC9J0N8_VIRHA|nr:ABC transporter permease [Virgibacillus halodenitrificans]APC47720.1 ABC transporter permease [Virgibacillus halodenitrificans]